MIGGGVGGVLSLVNQRQQPWYLRALRWIGWR